VHRLIYADWLEDHGGPGDISRAEFIRLQCALASGRDPDGTPITPEQRKRLTSRESELLKQHWSEWEEPLRQLGATTVTFTRGFPEKVSISMDHFIKHMSSIRAICPVQSAVILNHGNIEALAASPHLAKLTSLELWGNGISDAGARALAASPHLANLTHLDLGNNGIGGAGSRALAASRHLGKLTDLDLWGNGIGDAGAQALAASRHLGKLTRLDLGYNNIGDAGARALAASRHLAKLTHLDLGRNGITDAGARAMASSPHLANLTSLELEYNEIGEAALRVVEKRLGSRRGNATER